MASTKSLGQINCVVILNAISLHNLLCNSSSFDLSNIIHSINLFDEIRVI